MSILPTPYGGQNRMKLTKNEYLKGIIGVLLIIGLIFLYAFEFKYFSNTFTIEKLIVRALLFGLVIGIGLGYYYSKNIKDSTDKLQLYTFFILTSLVLSPLFASLSNRLLSWHEVKNVEVELEQQSTYIGSRFGKLEGQKWDGYYLIFYKDKKLERIKTRELVFPNARKGDMIIIPIKKGFWGYEYFKEFGK